MKKGISVLIVEDEFLTADTIKDGLEEMGYRISGMVKDATEALQILEKKTTDIAILDINIQGKRNGIWLGNEIQRKWQIPFLFLTAYSDQDTINSAIEAKPYSFLVKPFNKIDIYTAIELALKNFSKKVTTTTTTTTHEVLSNGDTPLLIDDYLFVKEKHLYSKIAIKDILFVQSELKYIQINLAKGKNHLLRYNLSDFLNILPNDNFIQVHRSYIINKDKIDHIGPNFLFINNSEIPISPSRKENLSRAVRML